MTDVLQTFDIQVAEDGRKVWVHAQDGSTVGRFDKRFGMDVHHTVTEQMDGKPECIECTHKPASREDWLRFCELMQTHYQIEVPVETLSFDDGCCTYKNHASNRWRIGTIVERRGKNLLVDTGGMQDWISPASHQIFDQ